MYQNITNTNNLYFKKESCENCKNKIICKYKEERQKIDEKVSELRKEATTIVFDIKLKCSSYTEESQNSLPWG